jgi:thiol-disulfide isomerase/thioredoxin
MKKLLSLLLSLAFAAGFVAQAAPKGKAALGDPAAPLKIAEWVKGKPVDLAAAKGKQVVVVEFWATWCGPCRTSIPHLTEMQKKFKDVIFIGVSTEEAGDVKPFVKKMGDKMDYAVAVDDDGKTSAGYMEAYGINGIPHAFVVDKAGNVVWQGHPMDGLEETLADIVAGKFSLEKSKTRADARQKLDAFAEAASNDPNDPKLAPMGRELEALDAELGGLLPGEKFVAADFLKRIKFQGAMRDYQMAVLSGKGAADLEPLEKQMVETAPKDFNLAEFKEALAANKLLNDYLKAAEAGDQTTLPDLTKRAGELKAKNPRLLLQVAWRINTDERLKVHDYDLAARLARSAIEATEGKDAGAYYVYGRALFESGKIADAVVQIKKAIETIGDNARGREELESVLKEYEARLAKK